MVHEPGLSSPLRAGGLVYSQFYGSSKEVVDAAKTYPFQNQGLEEMALDPKIRKTVNKLSGGRRRDLRVVENVYLASKRRLDVSTRDSDQKSFGVREEHRVTWAVFRALIERLEEEDDGEQQIMMDQAPSYVWAIQSSAFFRYVRRNSDRFATGFEVVAAQAHAEYYTWEQTKMMAMFLRCLQFSVAGSNLSRESALWWGRRTRKVRNDNPTERTWYGLGFSLTLPRYGYCWMEPRFNWATLIFHPDFTDNVLFGNSTLRRQYLKHGGQVQDFFDTTRRLDLAVVWLQRAQNHAVVRGNIIRYIVHLCLRQFRIDTMEKLSGVLPAYEDEARGGLEPFTYKYLT